MLTLYCHLLRIRRHDSDMRLGRFSWMSLGDDVVAFRRGERFASITNLGQPHVELPAGAHVLLSSGPLDRHAVPTDTTAWIRLAPAAAA